jgi:hypothetical protein
MSKFVTIEIHVTSDEDDDKKLYLQAFDLDYLMNTNPNWLSKVIAIMNDLDVKTYFEENTHE